jgi:DNA-directed RNA polymerase specialized sigma subunit
MLQEHSHPRALDIPARDSLVGAAIRQMAHDLQRHEAAAKPSAAAVLARATPVLRRRLGRTPTPAEIARVGGIEVEDVLDELTRRRRDPRASAA